MKPRLYRALPLAILLFAYSGGFGGRGASAAPLPQEDQRIQQAGQTQPSPSSSGTVDFIPGPLRSFLRMAGISQKVPPQEVLPLLARNVVTHGFTWQEGGRRPTEFLLLLRRYVDHARELQALAGPEGIIRVSTCSQAQPLLNALGYRLSSACGPRVALETADQKKAFITIDYSARRIGRRTAKLRKKASLTSCCRNPNQPGSTGRCHGWMTEPGALCCGPRDWRSLRQTRLSWITSGIIFVFGRIAW